MPGAQPGHELFYSPAARLPDDIADEQNLHAMILMPRGQRVENGRILRLPFSRKIPDPFSMINLHVLRRLLFLGLFVFSTCTLRAHIAGDEMADAASKFLTALDGDFAKAYVEFLADINESFADILVEGDFTQGSPLREEKDEPALLALPRLVFHFNRRSLGRLRQLIDAINRGSIS